MVSGTHSWGLGRDRESNRGLNSAVTDSGNRVQPSALLACSMRVCVCVCARAIRELQPSDHRYPYIHIIYAHCVHILCVLHMLTTSSTDSQLYYSDQDTPRTLMALSFHFLLT